MYRSAISLTLCALFCLVIAMPSSADDAQQPSRNSLDVVMTTLEGEKVNLSEKYKDRVVLLVNVASQCGLTPQYEGLQDLHEKFADRGLSIVGVPCNQFGRQEPGNSEEIRAFCANNYGVEFDLLSKVEVNGPGQCELYKFLTSNKANPEFGGEIQWNFEKFLFDRDGGLVERFSPRTPPESSAVVEKIEAELAKQ